MRLKVYEFSTSWSGKTCIDPVVRAVAVSVVPTEETFQWLCFDVNCFIDDYSVCIVKIFLRKKGRWHVTIKFLCKSANTLSKVINKRLLLAKQIFIVRKLGYRRTTTKSNSWTLTTIAVTAYKPYYLIKSITVNILHVGKTQQGFVNVKETQIGRT